VIGARDVEGRERLLRYVARPMVAGERVSELADGRIAWRRSIPGGRGETHRIHGAQGGERDEKSVGAKSSGRIDWATLMHRMWGWDVLACPMMRRADALHRRHQGARRDRAHPAHIPFEVTDPSRRPRNPRTSCRRLCTPW
jgi:hypothetical protein